MRKTIAFGEFKPDLPPADHLIAVENVIPMQTGYAPAREVRTFTPALAGVSGGAAFVGSDGSTSFLAGTAARLCRFVAGAWSTKLGGLAASRWRFAQFGDNVIAVNGQGPVSYGLLTGTAAPLAGNPPKANLVAVVRDFVVLAGDPLALLTVTWSGYNNSEQWTALTNQSDSQQMLDGGEVMGLAGGEYGIILQKNALKRMSYEGGEVIFRFDEISSNVGCMAKGSVAQTGRMVFFLSERGFMVCDGNDVRPIGAQKVDATFFRSYSRADIVDSLYAAVDPAQNVVVWSMPGNPGKLWCYHWTLDRWVTIETDVKLVFSGFTANTPADALDALYDNADAVPVSFDDAQFAGGNPLLLVATEAGAIGTPAGGPMKGTLTTARTRLMPGRSRLRSIRPIADALTASVEIQSAARAGDKPLVEGRGDMRPNGEIPVRVNGADMTIALSFSGPWTYAQGFEVEYEDGGRR